MISRENFIFIVGYEGNTAVVDGAMKRRYASLSTAELAEEGLFKAALSSALYSGRAEELEQVLAIYNGKTELKLSSVEDLKRIFGVFEVPAGIGKVMVV